MIVQGERPWDGVTRYGGWRAVEPLWDGTQRWEYVPPPHNTFLTLLQRLPSNLTRATKVAWLEDDFGVLAVTA